MSTSRPGSAGIASAKPSKQNPKATPSEWSNTFIFQANSLDEVSDWLRETLLTASARLEQVLQVVPQGRPH